MAGIQEKKAVTAKKAAPAAPATVAATRVQAPAKIDAASPGGKPVTSELKVEPAAGQASPPEVVTLKAAEWNNAW